jgi:hypothetical protein
MVVIVMLKVWGFPQTINLSEKAVAKTQVSLEASGAEPGDVLSQDQPLFVQTPGSPQPPLDLSH